MKRMMTIFIFLLFLLLAACGSSDSFNEDDLNLFDVRQTTAEVTEGDFVFRLISEKEEYEQGEKVQLYGEIEYIGDQDEVEINHSSSAVLFPMIEQVRGYEIMGGVNDIGITTTLVKGEPYREEFTKNAGFSPTTDPEEYIEFIQDFVDRDDFPPGFYDVRGETDFSHNGEHYIINAAVQFKVLDE